jgi:acyl-CoA thioesterase
MRELRQYFGVCPANEFSQAGTLLCIDSQCMYFVTEEMAFQCLAT